MEDISMLTEEKDQRTYDIIGAAMEVHRVLGMGFIERVYQDALEVEFNLRKIPFKREVEVPVYYKGQKLRSVYKADFICSDMSVIVELKSLSKLSGTEKSQIINYLKATKIKTGLLINFGKKSLEYERFVY
jgi:GxxExxY protein